MRLFFLFLAALVMALQIVKGLSVETSLYPLLSYIFSYEDGPVRRGLLPTLFKLLGVTSLEEIGRYLAGLHVLLLTILSGVLLARMAQLPYAGDRARRLLLWLVLASAVLPVLAATTGYVDVLLVLGLIAMAALLADGRAVSAALVLLVLMLQHEMVLVPGLCLFAAEALLDETSRKRTVWAGIAVVAMAVAYLAATAQYQAVMIPLAEARCAALRPALHALVQTVWDPYCVRQVTATLASDFVPLRLIVLPFYLLVYGALPVLLLGMAGAQLQGGFGWLRALALAGLLLVPYGLVAVAWDADRIIILASVTGWLIIDRWLQVQPLREVGLISATAAGLLVAAQLVLFYPAVDVYGQQRVVPPALAHRYLVDPRRWAIPVLALNGLKTPAFLDSATCIDSRCP